MTMPLILLRRKQESAFVMPDDVDDVHCPKKLRSSQPDVKVVVGGESFYHYSSIFCNCSDYFDAMLASNMKEGATKAIEFPDMYPDEWKHVYHFFEPAAATHVDIDVESISMLVPWFSELL